MRPLVRDWHWLLATSSRILFMDFRELEAVHRLVCEPKAAKVGDEVTEGAVSAFSDYLPAIWSVWLQRGSTDFSLGVILKLITWHLPYFTYHLRVVRREMQSLTNDGLVDLQWLRGRLVQWLWTLRPRARL